jgi:hypothetical protein
MRPGCLNGLIPSYLVENTGTRFVGPIVEQALRLQVSCVFTAIENLNRPGSVGPYYEYSSRKISARQ